MRPVSAGRFALVFASITLVLNLAAGARLGAQSRFGNRAYGEPVAFSISAFIAAMVAA